MAFPLQTLKVIGNERIPGEKIMAASGLKIGEPVLKTDFDAARDAVPLADAWRKQFPKIRLSCIGKITAAPGLKLRDAQGVRALHAHGYVHFS